MLPILLFVACTTPSDGDPDAAAIEVTELAARSAIPDATPTADGGRAWFLSGGDVCLFDEETLCTALVAASGLALSADDGTMVMATGEGVKRVSTSALIDALEGAAAAPSPEIIVGSDGVDVTAVTVDGTDVVFAGTEGGQASLWRLPLAGGAPEVLVADVADEVTGVVVGSDGVVWATGPAGDGTGGLFAIDGAATLVVSGIILGDPAGVALTPDDGSVMVSSLSDAGTAQVTLVDIATAETSIFDDTIRANHAAGGLHRAAGDPYTYAWADSGDDGRVYRVRFPRP